MKTYKGYELIKEIAEGNIEDGTRFKDSSGNIYIKTKYVEYLEDERGTPIIDCFNSLDDLALTLFEQIEEIECEINIQDIEELKYETVIEKLGAPDCFQGNEIYCLKTLSKNDENLLISNAENHKKINEIIRALKYIDNKIKEK